MDILEGIGSTSFQTDVVIEFKDLTIYPPTSYSWAGAFVMVDPTDDKAKYVMEWMKRNNIHSYTTVLVKEGIFYIGHPEDAVAFKLRWL